MAEVNNIVQLPPPWATKLDTTVDANPDDAARAEQIGGVTGTDPGVVYDNLDNHERNAKQRLSYGIVMQNPEMQRYIQNHPLAAEMSNDDWGNLAEVSAAIKKFGEPLMGPPVREVQAALKGFRKDFGDEPIGSSVTQQEESEFVTQYPYLSFLAGPAAAARIIGGEIPSRVASGLTGAAYQGLIQAGKDFGVPENKAEFFARSVAGFLEAEMTRQMGEGGATANLEAYHRQAADVMKAAQPYIEAGKIPPYGAHPLIDEVYKQDVEKSMDAIDEIQKATQKTNTIQRSRTMYENFLEEHPAVAGRMIGIDMEGIDKLYPEGKMPEPGDNILGDVPGIAQSIQLARETGGDVSVPLKSIAMADPDAYKELHDFIRPRPGGLTLEEAKAPEGEAEAIPNLRRVPSELTETPELDVVRNAAGLYKDRYEEIDKKLAAYKLGGERQDLLPQTAQFVDNYKSFNTDMGPAYTFQAKELLEKLDPNHLIEGPRALAEFFGDRIKKMAGDTPVYVVEDASRGIPGARAYYDPNTHHIVLPYEVVRGGTHLADAYSVIMEEAAHAATSKALFEFPKLADVTRRLAEETRDYLRGANPKIGELYSYAMSNEHEMLAWAQAHQGFQRLIMKVPVSEALKAELGLGKNIKSVWEAVRQIVRDLLKRLTRRDPPVTVMDAIFRIGEVAEKGQKQVLAEEGLAPGRAAQPSPKQPLTPGGAGITKPEQEAYLEKIRKEQESDQAYRQRITERNERLKQTAEWKENEAKVRATVTDELRHRPDIAADRFLREGKLYEHTVKRERLKGDLLTPEQKAGLPPDLFGARGLSPDFVAGLFGYHNGAALVDALKSLDAERQREALTPADHFRQLRDAETENRMRTQYGDLEANILQEAKDQALSDDTLGRMHEETLRIGAQAKQAPLTKEVIQQAIKEKMAGLNVKALDSDAILAKVGKWGREIEKAMLKGDFTTAYQLAQFRFQQALMAKEAIKYEKERAKSDRLMARSLRKRQIAGLSEEWTNWVHYLMFKGGEPPKRTPLDLKERMGKFTSKTFADFVNTYSYPQDYAPEMFDDAKTWKSQDDMTLDEWRGWSGAVQTLYNYGKDVQKFKIGGDDLDRVEARGKLTDQIEKGAFRSSPENLGYKTPFARGWGKIQTLYYGLIWIDSVWWRASHGDPNGILMKALSYRASSGVNDLSSWTREFSEDVGALAKYKINWRQKLDPIFKVPRRGDFYPMDKEALQKTIQYMGTRSGEDKIIRGWMLDGASIAKDDPIYQAAKDQLYQWLEKNSDKADWDHAAAVHAINERVFGKYEKMATNEGLVPAPREPLNPIMIHGKLYDGGYVKLSYDNEVGGTSKKLMGKEFDPEDAIGDSNFTRATTPRSHEKARTGYAGPLYLRMDRDNAQMTNVLRDAALRPFIIHASKMFYDPVFRDAVRDHMGEHIKGMLTPYLEGLSGKGEKMSPFTAAVSSTINYITNNTVSRLIGWSPITLAKHTLSVAVNSVGEVGARKLALESANMFTGHDLAPALGLDPKLNNWDAAVAFSGELPNRIRSAYTTTGGQWDRIQGKVGIKQFRTWMAEKGTAPIGYFDLGSAVPTWIVAVKESILEQAIQGRVDLGLARDIADARVRRAHGTTAESSLPEVRRMNAMTATLVKFYGFFNAMLQRNYEAYWRTRSAMKDVGGYLKDKDPEKYERGMADIRTAVKMFTLGTIFPSIVEEIITPYPGSDNDGYAKWSAKMALMGLSNMIPGVRELVHMAMYRGGGALGILGEGMEQMGGLLTDLEHGAKAFDAEHGGKTIKALNSLLGTLGYSNDQIGRTLKTGWDLSHLSKETPRNMHETIRDLARGSPREKP